MRQVTICSYSVPSPSHHTDALDNAGQVGIEMPCTITGLSSPTHRLRSKQTDTMATVELAEAVPSLETGFTLVVGLSQAHVPRMWVEEDAEGHQATMLTFYPDFGADDPGAENSEFDILLDLSCSMKGGRIVFVSFLTLGRPKVPPPCRERGCVGCPTPPESCGLHPSPGKPLQSAKKVALLALERLPEGSYFNVIAFGDTHEEVFPAARRKTKETMQDAVQFIISAQASLGGSQLW